MSLRSISYLGGQEASPGAAQQLLLSGTGQAEGHESGSVCGAVDPGLALTRALGGWRALVGSCCVASMGHLSLLMLLLPGGGRDLKNHSWGVLQLGSLLLQECLWILRVGGPRSLPAGFSMSGSERKKNSDPTPATTLPRLL